MNKFDTIAKEIVHRVTWASDREQRLQIITAALDAAVAEETRRCLEAFALVAATVSIARQVISET